MNQLTPITEVNTSRFAQIQAGDLSLKLHYNDAGIGIETIVLLHGSGPGASAWSNFHRNVDPLVAAGYRVLMMDSPGWGKSDTVVSKGSRSELNATALRGLLDVLGIEKAHLIGNSMGAHSAVAFALANPKRTGKLVLMGGGTGGASSFAPSPTEGIKLIGALYRAPTLDNLKRMMNVFVYDASQITEALMQGRLDNMLSRKDHLENFVRSVEINPRQFPDVAHRLHELAHSTLIIWGRDDRFVPLDTGLRLLAGLQNAELHVFSRCGHWAQWEHAEKFNRMVVEFFAD
jgi:2-hydroxy-6-oxonona-2,4-dienedioate hydrolase